MRAIIGKKWTPNGRYSDPIDGLGLEETLERAPVAICLVGGNERHVTLANATFRDLIKDDCLIGRPLGTVLPACEAALSDASTLQTLSLGEPLRVDGAVVERGSVGATEQLTWLVLPLAKQGKSLQLMLTTTTSTPLQRSHADSALPTRRDVIAELIHELRGPLAPMRAAIDLLQSCEPEVLERVRAILNRQMGAMSRLIQDLYELARSDRAQLPVLRDRISVDAVIERSIELARPLLLARRHLLTVSVEAGQWIEADAGRLVQVLANLLVNAAKYTDMGGKIWLDGRVAFNEFIFSVRDNGIGIAADVLPRVFDAFVRSSRARRQEHDGSGLGLSVVRTIVKQHGGTVEVRSDGPDRGSEFIVRLPHAQTVSQPADCVVT